MGKPERATQCADLYVMAYKVHVAQDLSWSVVQSGQLLWLSSSPGPSPLKRGLVVTVCAWAKYPGFIKYRIPTVHQLHSYTNCACVFHERESDYLSKVLLHAIFVVKAYHVQDGTATSDVWREISVSVATNVSVWEINSLSFHLTVRFGKMILPHLKSNVKF